MLKTFIKTVFVCVVCALFAALPASTCGQDEIPVGKVTITRSALPEMADKIGDFVPAGWKVEEDIVGDVTDDGIEDHLLKLIEDKPATDKEDAPNERSRALLIVTADKEGKLRVAALTDKLLQCTLCGGAFYGVGEAPANISLAKGVIIVQQDHGSRWVSDMTFRFRYDEQPGMFILIGFDYTSRDRTNGESASESTNYLTGARVTTTSKSNKTATKKTQVAKNRYSIEEVDASKFEAETVTRLGL